MRRVLPAVSIITGGGKWVEISIPMEPGRELLLLCDRSLLAMNACHQTIAPSPLNRGNGVHSPIYYLAKFVKHLQRGSLRARCEQAFTQCRWALRERWWSKQAVTRKHFDYDIEPGVRLRLHFDSAIAKDIYCHDHELAERAFIRRFLRPGDTFVDVGANLGLYSIIASQLVGSDGFVCAFEPDPMVYSRLLFNLQTNSCSNVKAFQLALSNADELRAMQISNAGYDAYNSFGIPVRGDGTFETREVACVRYDSFARREPRLRSATMIKVDVEGWESMVLKGAVDSLSREPAPLLQLEFNDQAAKALGLPCSELYKWLRSLGYSIYTFDLRRQQLIPHPLLDHYVYDNVLATKDIQSLNKRIGLGASAWTV
jgi:FkbM family methyltransferase